MPGSRRQLDARQLGCECSDQPEVQTESGRSRLPAVLVALATSGAARRRDRSGTRDIGVDLQPATAPARMPIPAHPEHRFMFDHTKWVFYAASCYVWLGDSDRAEEHALRRRWRDLATPNPGPGVRSQGLGAYQDDGPG